MCYEPPSPKRDSNQRQTKMPQTGGCTAKDVKSIASELGLKCVRITNPEDKALKNYAKRNHDIVYLLWPRFGRLPSPMGPVDAVIFWKGSEWPLRWEDTSRAAIRQHLENTHEECVVCRGNEGLSDQISCNRCAARTCSMCLMKICLTDDAVRKILSGVFMIKMRCVGCRSEMLLDDSRCPLPYFTIMHRLDELTKSQREALMFMKANDPKYEEVMAHWEDRSITETDGQRTVSKHNPFKFVARAKRSLISFRAITKSQNNLIRSVSSFLMKQSGESRIRDMEDQIRRFIKSGIIPDDHVLEELFKLFDPANGFGQRPAWWSGFWVSPDNKDEEHRKNECKILDEYAEKTKSYTTRHIVFHMEFHHSMKFLHNKNACKLKKESFDTFWKNWSKLFTIRACQKVQQKHANNEQIDLVWLGKEYPDKKKSFYDSAFYQTEFPIIKLMIPSQYRVRPIILKMKPASKRNAQTENWETMVADWLMEEHRYEIPDSGT